MVFVNDSQIWTISIHSPRKGRDVQHDVAGLERGDFNPLSPQRERRPVSPSFSSSTVFQSTLPAKGETVTISIEQFEKLFQSTLPAKGETKAYAALYPLTLISIHSPRKGRDCKNFHLRLAVCSFQSTLPAKGETEDDGSRNMTFSISIHSPRKGRDSKSSQ